MCWCFFRHVLWLNWITSHQAESGGFWGIPKNFPLDLIPFGCLPRFPTKTNWNVSPTQLANLVVKKLLNKIECSSYVKLRACKVWSNSPKQPFWKNSLPSFVAVFFSLEIQRKSQQSIHQNFDKFFLLSSNIEVSSLAINGEYATFVKMTHFHHLRPILKN